MKHYQGLVVAESLNVVSVIISDEVAAPDCICTLEVSAAGCGLLLLLQLIKATRINTITQIKEAIFLKYITQDLMINDTIFLNYQP